MEGRALPTLRTAVEACAPQSGGHDILQNAPLRRPNLPIHRQQARRLPHHVRRRHRRRAEGSGSATECLNLAQARAWKKDVCEGSRPVLPSGTTTSLGATRPTRAGAPTLNLLISSRTCRPAVYPSQRNAHINQGYNCTVLSLLSKDNLLSCDCLSSSGKAELRFFSYLYTGRRSTADLLRVSAPSRLTAAATATPRGKNLSCHHRSHV